MGLSAVVVARPRLAQGRGHAWPDGRAAAVSLTYDDGLDSQLDNAVPQLDALGLKATFFVTGENMDARLADWVALGKRGHEIANHTLTHPCALGAYSGPSFQRKELGAMETYLNDHFGPSRARTFAYPCGDTELGGGSPAQRRARYLHLLRGQFAAARTVAGAPNDPRRVSRSLYDLHAFEPTYDHDITGLAFDYVGKALATGAWAILVFHEVLEKRAGEGDTSMGVHQAILSWLIAQSVWCAPVQTVLTHIEQT
ncbi:MAG TPA: polysaccharide deacetylase family protein [Caulobacteraceae bacterium]|nr:polysaccharide deacetylase family protein [Caulobacteraceae bacterium]